MGGGGVETQRDRVRALCDVIRWKAEKTEAAIMIQIWRGIMPTIDANRPVELEEEEIVGGNDDRTVRICHTLGHAAAAVSTT